MSHIIGYTHLRADMPDALERLGKHALDHVFIDRGSGKRARRPQLAAAVRHLRCGDRLVVPSMSCLARNASQLHGLVREFHAKGVAVQFVEHGVVINADPNCPVSRSMLALLEAFVQFERQSHRQRQRQGIALAREQGLYRGRKPKVTAAVLREIQRRLAMGEKRAAIAQALGLGVRTVYRYAQR